MASPTRRELARAAALGAASLSFPALATAGRRRDDEVRVACVGIRSRGNAHIGGFARLPGVKVVALCDVDEKVLADRLREAAEKGRPADGYTDLRKLLERDDIDAVSFGTPNHLHALHTIWACQAGKHVYVEKPISHNIWEGGQAVKAARKYGRIVQSGTQSRSSHAIRDGIAWLQGGNLGAITHAWGTCFKPRKSIGKVKGPQEVPASVHWDLYCGPRGEMPLNRRSLHYDWHWQMATGNGDLGNQGIHQVDQCRWGLGQQALAPRVFSVGGRFGYDDDGDSPNTQFIFLDYDPAPMIFEVRGLPKDKAAAEQGNWGAGMDRYAGSAIGATIHAEGGHLHIPNYTSARAVDADGKVVQEWRGADDHYQNFVDAIRADDASLLNGDIQEGHLSSALCHMGLDSHKLGEEATPDAITGALADAALTGADLCSEAWGRFQGHMEAHGIDLASTRATLGRTLRLDPATEEYLGDAEANTMRRGTYAEGFVVPEEV